MGSTAASLQLLDEARARGVDVFVNGQAVLLDGTPTGLRPGRALRSTD